MKKYILLAAVAAIVAPTGAIAQQHSRNHHGTSQTRGDHRTTRANRQTVRSDHRTARANRQAVRSDHRVIAANHQAMRGNHNSGYRTHSAYHAPIRNWRYRPVTVGYRLQPSFYGSTYYISDYGMYHLRAPGSRWDRWIRYGDDLLLVNIRTGRVLQVIHYAGW